MAVFSFGSWIDLGSISWLLLPVLVSLVWEVEVASVLVGPVEVLPEEAPWVLELVWIVLASR